MISIVMPYYMRQEALDRSLQSIHAQYGHDGLGEGFEIVVCDDGSPVPVRAFGCRIVSLPVKNHGLNPCVPINRAVAVSTGGVIVITNPEIEHRTPILREMRHDLGSSDYVIAACRDVTGTMLCGSEVKGGENGRGPIPQGAGFHFCAMLHRSLWDKAGGFDEAYREGMCFDDNDWLFRLQAAGARFKMRDDLVVWHHRVDRPPWPEGGWERNRQLFQSKWGERKEG